MEIIISGGPFSWLGNANGAEAREAEAGGGELEGACRGGAAGGEQEIFKAEQCLCAGGGGTV